MQTKSIKFYDAKLAPTHGVPHDFFQPFFENSPCSLIKLSFDKLDKNPDKLEPKFRHNGLIKKLT